MLGREGAGACRWFEGPVSDGIGSGTGAVRHAGSDRRAAMLMMLADAICRLWCYRSAAGERCKEILLGAGRRMLEGEG